MGAGLKWRLGCHMAVRMWLVGTPLKAPDLEKRPRAVAASEVAALSRSQNGGLGVGLPAGPAAFGGARAGTKGPLIGTLYLPLFGNSKHSALYNKKIDFPMSTRNGPFLLRTSLAHPVARDEANL